MEKVKLLEEIKRNVREDKDVFCIFLFGSYVRNESHYLSDIDVCLVLSSNNYSSLQMSQKKLEYLKTFPQIDIQIFQQLPLYIKIRILKEGKILLCKDEDKIYDLAFSVITEYSDYEHILRDYLTEVDNAG
jgi:hypothetical protein